MDITYRTDITPSVDQIISLYESAALPRPTDDPSRIEKMFKNSDLVVSAWDGSRLVGVCRCITDWAWACYLSDLAVSPDCKQKGIGKELIRITQEKLGDESMILLLSVPTAMDYYPKVGFSKENRAFIIHRKK